MATINIHTSFEEFKKKKKRKEKKSWIWIEKLKLIDLVGY